MDWKTARNVPFDILFLLGGGVAIAQTFKATGVSEALAELLGATTTLPPMLMIALIVLLVTFLTEVTSNTATTSMMLPVLIGIAQASGFDATRTAVAVTLAASYAFMLPVSTPPNAMAYGTRMVRLDAMVSFGIRLDLLGFVVLMGMVVGILPLVL